ncbi:MAG: LysR family transcriptional regulator, partial [Mesorhizobium sp.]
GQTSQPEIVDALARHIAESLDNISVPVGEETGSFDFAALAFAKMKRTKANQILPGW